MKVIKRATAVHLMICIRKGIPLAERVFKVQNAKCKVQNQMLCYANIKKI